MPVAGGPKITKTGILLDVDAADTTSYPGSGTTWTNNARLGSNNGTLNNISFDPADSKGALIFTGSNTYVDFGNIGDLSSAWSFQVAFKPAPTSSGDAYTILSYASGSDTGSLTFKLDYSSSTQEVILSTFSTASATAKTVHAISASVASGSWSILNGTYGTSILALFKDGNFITSVPTTGSTVGYNSSNRLYLGGTYGLDLGFYTGSVASLVVNQADLDIRAVTNNYNAFFSRFGLTKTPGLVTDFDAINFIEATGLANETQAVAINDLVVGLKANNLWTKMVAIYPFAGGTATSHKYNLKNLDTYSIIWSGVVEHTNKGAKVAGGYGNTTLAPALVLPSISDSHVTMYNTELGGGNGMFGNGDPYYGANGTLLTIVSNNRFASRIFGDLGEISQPSSVYPSGSLGFFAATRRGVNEESFYVKNPQYTSTSNKTSTTTSTPATDSILLGRDGATYSGNATFGFVTIGTGLTESEVDILYNLIDAYQIAFGRQVTITTV